MLNHKPLKITDWIPPEKVEYSEFAEAMNANCSFLVVNTASGIDREMTPAEIALLKIHRLEKLVAELHAENEQMKAGK